MFGLKSLKKLKKLKKVKIPGLATLRYHYDRWHYYFFAPTFPKDVTLTPEEWAYYEECAAEAARKREEVRYLKARTKFYGDKWDKVGLIAWPTCEVKPADDSDARWAAIYDREYL